MQPGCPTSSRGSGAGPGADRTRGGGREVDPAGVDGLVEAIDHVGLAVADLDAAIDLHTRVLGWRLVHTETNLDQHVVEAMLETGDGSGTRLQLMAPLGPESVIARFLQRRGPGLQQLAYRVGDVAAVSRELRSRGLRLLYDEPRSGSCGTLINFVHPHDTLGVLIELVQPSNGGPTGSTGPSDRIAKKSSQHEKN